MKKFKYLGIIAIMLFSFYYTEQIATLSLKSNEVYRQIENNKDSYLVESVNAQIDDNNITPGLYGKKVNVKSSYYNMKELNVFNSYYLVYEDIYPSVSVFNNKDKIINRGNSLKNSVSFVSEYDSNIIDFFNSHNYKATILVDKTTFNKNETLEQINNDNNNYNSTESLLNKYGINKNICYITNENDKTCRKNKKLLVSTDKLVNKSNLITLKEEISSGDIYYIPKSTDTKTIQLLINNIMYKDLDIVYLSKLISEERD